MPSWAGSLGGSAWTVETPQSDRVVLYSVKCACARLQPKPAKCKHGAPSVPRGLKFFLPWKGYMKADSSGRAARVLRHGPSWLWLFAWTACKRRTTGVPGQTSRRCARAAQGRAHGMRRGGAGERTVERAVARVPPTLGEPSWPRATQPPRRGWWSEMRNAVSHYADYSREGVIMRS